MPHRTLPLFDRAAEPASWNERMAPGEFAVLYSEHEAGGEAICTIFDSVAEAKRHAEEEIARRPTLECRVYDHNGLAGQPVLEVQGVRHKAERGITAGFRRWVGSFLFLAGVLLVLVDWHADFRLSWPAMLGFRMAPAGLILLVIEAVLLIEQRRAARRAKASSMDAR